MQDSSTSRVQKLADDLGGRICSGEFRSGDTLPSERALAQEYGVAPMTLRNALSRLEARGLILRRHGKRTLVTSSTQRMTVGLLVGPSLNDESAGYYRAIVAGFRSAYAQREWTFRVYDGLQVTSARQYTQHQSIHRQLRSDLSNASFDGLVEIHVRRDVWENEPNLLPSVAMGSRRCTDVDLDLYQVNRTLVRHLYTKGCRRIACLRTRFQDIETAWMEMDDLNGIFDSCQQLDLPVPVIAEAVIASQDGFRSLELYERVLDVVKKWKQQPERQRPDGLIVSDDIVMHAVSKALLTEGISGSDALKVVLMTHDTSDHHYLTPIARCLFSVREQVDAAGAMLECRMQGREPERRPVLIAGRIVEE